MTNRLLSGYGKAWYLDSEGVWHISRSYPVETLRGASESEVWAVLYGSRTPRVEWMALQLLSDLDQLRGTHLASVPKV